MNLVAALSSTLMNLILLAGIPFTFYVAYHHWRHKRSFIEIARRAGLGAGQIRYIGYGAAAAAVVVCMVAVFPPSAESMTRKGSAWREFVGLGFSVQAVSMALLYGVIKTGFAEELLFRGLIAGSLSRRLPLVWANVLQALIFLLPHLPLLAIVPELWWILVLVFGGALLSGWLRIKSGSILAAWLIHASANVAMALSTAIRTAA